MAKGARRHLKRLGAEAAVSGKVSNGVIMRKMVLALSIALQRGNGGFCFRQACRSDAAGRQVVYGLPQPTAQVGGGHEWVRNAQQFCRSCAAESEL